MRHDSQIERDLLFAKRIDCAVAFGIALFLAVCLYEIFSWLIFGKL